MMVKCPVCDKEIHQSDQYKGWCLNCVGKVQRTANASPAPEDAPRITMMKNYLSGRQCCDFAIAEDDSETHEEGCPWRIVDEFAKEVYKHGCPVTGCSLPWIENRIAKLEEDMCNSPIRRVEDAPGGPTDG